jgi:signal transduction histidine kinase
VFAVTTGAFASTARSHIAGWLSLTGDAWRRLTPRHFLAALALGAAVTVWEILISGPFLPFWFILPELALEVFSHLDALGEFFRYELIAVILLLSVAIADRAVDTGRAGREAYVLALFLAVGLAAPLAYAIAPYHGEEGKWGTWLVPSVVSAMSWLLFGGLAVFVYVDRKRARGTRERLAAAELDRTKRAKQTLESRLAAMQARVEPQFLFNTLAQVGKLYELDVARAERMLDDLIAYLRAAMPKMRDTSSTLAQEIELARAYLAIIKVRLADRLSFEIEQPGDLGSARMPPMMLLPLIDHAIVHGLESSTVGGSIRIRIRASDGQLLLTVTDSGVGFVPETSSGGIASIRERLAALYSSGARLVLRSSEMGTSEALMEIPLERVEADEQPLAG